MKALLQTRTARSVATLPGGNFASHAHRVSFSAMHEHVA
jgi:hypothetical protein